MLQTWPALPQSGHIRAENTTAGWTFTTLFGNSQNRHSYVVGFKKTLVIDSRQHFRIMIDGDDDGFFMGTIPLADKVALVTEAIPIEHANVKKPKFPGSQF